MTDWNKISSRWAIRANPVRDRRLRACLGIAFPVWLLACLVIFMTNAAGGANSREVIASAGWVLVSGFCYVRYLRKFG